VVQDPVLGNVFLRAYLLRRSLMIGRGAGLRIVGSRYSPDTLRLREFADRNRLPHRWVDVDNDPQAEALLADLGVRPEETPVVLWRGETVLRNPSTAELARVVGLRQAHPCDGVCDLVIVGAGPAGLAAAVYGASEGLTTVMLESVASGGQAGSSPQIENYLGFPLGIPGADLADRAAVQAEKFGARLTVPAEALALERHENHYVVAIDEGENLHSRTVVIATGARYRKLDVPRLEDFEGTSIYHAATHVEAQLCHSEPVAVVGGGNSAAQAAMFLSRRAQRVHLLVRSDDLGKSMSRYLAQRIEQNPDIEVLLNTEVKELHGDRVLEGIVIEDRRTGERRPVEARALFVFIGADPHTAWLGPQVTRDDHEFVVTGATSLQTNLAGVFAVGDVRSGSIKRVAAAVGEGATVIRQVHTHLATTR
jgi:thioredoxin reductase (NADPH)